MQQNNPGVLIHYGNSKFNPEKFIPARNRPGCGMNKPIGGLWASPLNSKWGWKHWCDAEQFRECTEGFQFTLSDKANIVVLNNLMDLKELPLVPSSELIIKDFMELDFNKLLASGVDAVWLTLNGLNSLGRCFHFEGMPPFYGWDCESVLILRPDNIVIQQ